MSVFEKSIWPCHTPDLFWALSEDLEDVAKLSLIEDDSIEYVINRKNLEGRYFSYFNALRDIDVDLLKFPSQIRSKIKSVTLCAGSKALEEIYVDYDDEIQFSMFKESNILPFFVIGDDALMIRILFKKDLTDNERLLLPHKSVNLTGLLVKILSKSTAFFVGASRDSILTYNGKTYKVSSKLYDEKEDTDESEEESSLSRWKAVHSDQSTFLDLCNALQTGLDTPKM